MLAGKRPLAAPIGPEPRDTRDVLLEQETSTAKGRLRRRIVQVSAGVLALLYAVGYGASVMSSQNVAQWQGQDRYETRDQPKK